VALVIIVILWHTDFALEKSIKYRHHKQCQADIQNLKRHISYQSSTDLLHYQPSHAQYWPKYIKKARQNKIKQSWKKVELTREYKQVHA
jgi:hypothetical protein